MGFAIIHDAEKGIAALIDPEGGVALGPILATEGDPTASPPVLPGERAKELLDVFASGLAHSLGEDPAAINAISLARHFDNFISTLMDDTPAEEAGAAVTAAVDAERRGEPAGHGEQGGLAGPSSSGETAREQGAIADENADGSLKADGGLPTGMEQAREAADPTASAETVSAENERETEGAAAPSEGPGIPKA